MKSSQRKLSRIEEPGQVLKRQKVINGVPPFVVQLPAIISYLNIIIIPFGDSFSRGRAYMAPFSYLENRK